MANVTWLANEKSLLACRLPQARRMPAQREPNPLPRLKAMQVRFELSLRKNMQLTLRIATTVRVMEREASSSAEGAIVNSELASY